MLQTWTQQRQHLQLLLLLLVLVAAVVQLLQLARLLTLVMLLVVLVRWILGFVRSGRSLCFGRAGWWVTPSLSGTSR